MVIFGSSVKGGLAPKDVDVLVVCSDEVRVSEVKRKFDDLPEEVQVQVVKLGDLLNTHTLLKQAVIHEGFSLKFNVPMRQVLGFESHTLFTFSLNGLTQNEKVKFQYALYGRNSQNGVLKDNGGRQVAPGAILVPVGREGELEDFFKNWRTVYAKERWMTGIK